MSSMGPGGPGCLDERTARAALCRLGEPGQPKLARLVEAIGAPELYDRLRTGRGPQGLADDTAARLGAIDPEADLRRAAARGIRYVVPGDAEWPTGLDALALTEPVAGRWGPPLGLWVRGPLRLDAVADQAVAVVGSRSSTTYGDAVAKEMGGAAVEAGWALVSGAAFGIDQAAHRGALARRGPTVAVLACGADRAYPTAHDELIDYIGETGLVVSEAAPGCAPTKIRFLSRNRLIAALAQGTVVVEAADRSGAANTATWTEQLNRPVMAVPGPVTSATSVGTHQLIRERGALLVTCGAEMLEVVAPSGQHVLPLSRGPSRPHDLLDPTDQQVLEAVPAVRAAGTESIARTAGLAPALVEPALERLVEAGLVDRAGHGHRLRREVAS